MKFVVSINIQRVEHGPAVTTCRCGNPGTRSCRCITSITTSVERTKDTVLNLTVTADTLEAAVAKATMHLGAELPEQYQPGPR